MDAAEDMEQTTEHQLDFSLDAHRELVKILNALGNEDTLAIFIYAADEIHSSQQAIRTLGLSSKRYYSRIKDLLDTKLITKEKGAYRHTALGKYFYKLEAGLETVLENRDRLELINEIGKAGTLSREEAQGIADALSINNLIGDSIGHAKIVDTFEKAVYNVINFIDSAEESIHFASKYADIRVSEACINAIGRGVEAFFVVENQEQYANALKILKPMIMNPKYLKIVVQYLRAPQMNVKHIDLPYTFLVVDEKKSMIEVPKPFTNKFSLSIFFENENFSRKLVENFNALWERGSEVQDKISF